MRLKPVLQFNRIEAQRILTYFVSISSVLPEHPRNDEVRYIWYDTFEVENGL